METVNSLIIISINPNTATSAVMGISRLNLDSGNFDWNKSAPFQFAYKTGQIEMIYPGGIIRASQRSP